MNFKAIGQHSDPGHTCMSPTKCMDLVAPVTYHPDQTAFDKALTSIFGGL